MGGRGSGTWSRWDTTAKLDDLLTVDVGNINRFGFLVEGVASGNLTWSSRGREIAKIEVVASKHYARFIYTWTRYGQEPVNQDLRIEIAWTPCNYGGERPWFRCPHCNRRFTKLYGRGTFKCRKCWGLKYSSQCESAIDRLLDRRNTIQRRLECDSNGPLEKPCGMHWRTYHRLVEKYEEADRNFWFTAAKGLR